MSGETDLSILLRQMRPELRARPYVFCTVEPTAAADFLDTALGLFREEEGVTLILGQAEARAAGLPAEPAWACISLRVHSALEAVGLTAAISARLAAAGLSANIVAGYYHDHLFVPWARRDQALAALAELSAQ